MFKMSYRSLPLVLALLAAPLAAQDVVAEPKATAGKRRLSVAPIKFSAERHLVVPKLRYDGSHPITFEAIVSSLYRGSIMGDFNGSGLGLSVANGYCSFHVNDGREGNSGYATIKATKSIGRDKPVHVAGVFDGKELRLYVGGELQGGETIGEFNKSKHPFMIGADPGGGGEPTKYLHGNIDKVRISTTVRFKQSFTPPTAFESDDQTLVLYRFSERDGDFVSDASGNGRHAHIVSARKELVRPEAESPDLQTRVARLEKEVAQLKALLKIALKQRATDPQQVAIDRLRELGGKITVTDGKATKANLTNSAISDAEMELIGSLTSLQLLTLNGCRNLTDAGLVHLKPLTGLKGLALERTNITDAGLENLKGLKELTLLSLNWTRVGDAGLVHLQDMKKMGTLYLCATQTADAGVASFKNMKQLSWLDLRSTRVTDAGLKHLSGLSKMRLLSLYGIPMTDAGVGSLSELSNLEQLTLNHTPVTDAGLLPLRRLPKLHELNVRDTRVTQRGLEQIKKALPDCRIDILR